MLESLIGSVKNGVKKVGVTVFAGYSALVIGLGSCGDTNNYYGETGGSGGNREYTCETVCDQGVNCGTMCRASECGEGMEEYDDCVDDCLEDLRDGELDQAFLDCASTSCDQRGCYERYAR